MKKLFLFLLASVICFFITVYLIILVFEDRFIEAFKSQFIDKSSININFSQIHFSIFKNFPYGSFILDDAQIFYSKDNNKDTLLKSKLLSFKINTINLFQRIYEFPEIIIANGTIDLKGDKIDLLFPKTISKQQVSNYLIDIKRIKFKKCLIKYSYKKIISLNLHLDNSTVSGLFLTNTLSLRFDLRINSLTGSINDFNFRSKNVIEISTIIKKQDDRYYSENGTTKLKSFPFAFSFAYSTATNILQVTSSIKNISAKDFSRLVNDYIDIPVMKGKLSLDSYYSINFNNSNSQKLILKYKLQNVIISNYTDISLVSLNGMTTFLENFAKNNTEISQFTFRNYGIEFEGTSKIKDIPYPLILIDSKFKNYDDISSIKNYTLSGNFWGNVKSLVKIDNIKLLNLNTLHIIKLNSELNFTNLSIQNIDYLKNLAGTISIYDNNLQFKGEGKLFNEKFYGALVLTNFLDVVFNKHSPSPAIYIEMEHLNMDSILILSNKRSDTSNINFHLNSRIKSLQYKELIINDLVLNLRNLNGNYFCDYFTLKAFSGIISGKFNYSKQNGNIISLSAHNLNIQSVFKNFNNFEQKVLTNKNITGTLSGIMDLSYTVFSNGNIDPMSIKLVSRIAVDDGKLFGVNQLKKISKFLNLKEMDSISFKSLQNQIEIENGIVKIPSMDISSNAINFRLTGQHKFNGEFTYWVKLNIREILSKKFLLNKPYNAVFENDINRGLNLYLKILGDSNSFNISFDKKSTADHLKSNFNQEGLLLKSIIKEEFGFSKKSSPLQKDSLSSNILNKIDSSHNKSHKNPFRIEWDEIDSTKTH